MKKIIFIFLIVFGLFVFNVTQAPAGTCHIQYSFDSNDTDFCYPASGSISTQQTSKTETAAEELAIGLGNPCLGAVPCQPPYYSWANNCYSYSIGCMGAGRIGAIIEKKVCLDGTFVITESVDTGYKYYAYGQWDVVCEPTVIKLSSFFATPKASKVIFQWTTESEIDNAGFNLYRSASENGEYIKINASLIPAKGSSTQGASYGFIDDDVQNRKTYYYKLEDIDLNGKSTMHGSVSATPRLIYGVGK
jgi:hypothetical protein